MVLYFSTFHFKESDVLNITFYSILFYNFSLPKIQIRLKKDMAEQSETNVNDRDLNLKKYINEEENNENENEETVNDEIEKERREQLQKIKETLFGLPTNIILKLIQKKIDLSYYKVRKESIQTLSRCVSVFILYITDCALEHAEHDKRSTIQTQDIIAALDESLFIDIAEELKELIANDKETSNKEGQKINAALTNNMNMRTNEETQNKTGDGKDDFDILLEALE